MNLTKTEIVEYLVVLFGVIGLLAYVHADSHPPARIAQTPPMMIEATGGFHASAVNSAGYFCKVILADAGL